MAKKFDFLSPGVEIREIDQSFIPAEVEAEGPIIIGRTRKGPANKPVKVRTLDDFITVFGAPVPGGSGVQGDMWRDGNTTGPTYASYAAQAWLASEESPVTIVRLAGEQAATPSNNTIGKAGWEVSGTLSSVVANNGTAYGLFVIASASADTMTTGSLAAVFYADRGYLSLVGTSTSGSTTIRRAGEFIKSTSNNCGFKLAIYDEDNTKVGRDIPFNFDRNHSQYIRGAFNTNPQLVNEDTIAASSRKTYWLGESFTRELVDRSLDGLVAGAAYGVLLPLQSGSVNWADHKEGAKEAQSGWVVSQQEKNQVQLFRLKTLHVGDDIQKNYMVGIEEIAESPNPVVNPYGSFTVTIKNMSGQTVERYTSVNLNKSSPDYIGKRIGTQYMSWDEEDRKYIPKGEYQNQSDLVYVEIDTAIDQENGGQGLLPAGFRGPVRPKGFTLLHGSTGAQSLGDLFDNRSAMTATVTLNNTAIGNFYNTVLRITDVSGTEKRYIIQNTSTGDTGTTTSLDPGSGAVDHIVVGVSGLTYETAVAQLVSAINGANGHNGTITASDDGGGVLALIAVGENTASTPALSTQNQYTDAGSQTWAAYGIGSNTEFANGTDSDNYAQAFVKGNTSMPAAGGDASNFVVGPTNFSASFQFPSIPLRESGTEGGASNPYRAYWGIRPKLSTTSNQNDPDYVDYLRRLPVDVDSYDPSTNSDALEYSYVFTLDDIKINTGTNVVTYVSGAYDDGGSPSYSQSTSFGELLNKNVRQFLMPMWGGHEGWDITEKEPLRDGRISAARDDAGDYTHYTINKAIDSILDPEDVPANLLLMPGIRKPVVTNRLIDVAQERQDVLAIIDLQGDYLPQAERTSAQTEDNSIGSVDEVVDQLKQRNLNSSYAAAYYPYVQAVDNLNGGQYVWLPPSVAALGAMAKSQAQTDVWFAPAGFNRGGLGSLGGPRGPKVLQARRRVDSKERDRLYENSVNPIATFPAEGIVVFGQKTLLVANEAGNAGNSALSRINVRRLMLYLKSRVNVVAKNLLFDPNLPVTWGRFQSKVEPILSDARARFGLSEYKLILDETTTTEDLVDRNIMYAKIFVKPARAIEYVVVDFVITKTGAEFV